MNCNFNRIFILGSDVIEIPIAPEPPVISKATRTPSPIPADGAGDCLSIDDTNKLRAKLGLKPLEVGSSEVQPTPSKNEDENEEVDESVADLKRIKDDWGEFYHKPAGTHNEKSEVQKLRDKIREKRDKRKIEQKLARVKTLGQSDSDDDPTAWVVKSREIEKQKAAKRAKMLNEMDEEFDAPEEKPREPKKRNYREKELQGLRVEHDLDNFTEDKAIILTLKDQDVLNEDGDALVNVNLIDDERYKKNIENKKQNPQTYGYDVYEDTFDAFGNAIDRGVLRKYDEEIETAGKSSGFTIGDSGRLQYEQQRKMAEIKAKLQNKTLESLDTEPLRLANDYYTAEELTKFKKPKKKIKKIRQKFRADDLLEIAGDTTDVGKDLGSRAKKMVHSMIIDDTPTIPEDYSNIKIDIEDDDLEQVLSKARRLKQKENIIKKSLPAEAIAIKPEVKEEVESDEESTAVYRSKENGFITLNATAEFCRTLGDIPTYGMAGNREDNAGDMMDIEAEVVEDPEEVEKHGGQWNAVNPDQEQKMDEAVLDSIDEVQILDEEPDVAIGVAAALKLAISKGYLEKDDQNRPSNSRFAHLQAKHYSIDDKTHGEDDKYSRRGDRFAGPTSEFREKEGFKPNVKLEYIDDSGHLLNSKEAFRYLSHKFHGKGPGKNKVEKRLKKNEQEGVSFKGIKHLKESLFNQLSFFLFS